MNTNHSSAAQNLLDRHQLRRRQSIPALTALASPVGVGIHLWRGWNVKRAVPVVLSNQSDPAAIVQAWAATLARHHELAEAAIVWLARGTGTPADDWRPGASAMTLHDLDRVWESHPFGSSDAPLPNLVRFLMRRHVLGERLDPATLMDRLRTEVFPRDHNPGLILNTLASLVPAERLPAILLTPPPAADLLSWLDGCARGLGSLVSAAPALAAAIACPAEAVDTFLGRQPESHWQALLREGVVRVEGLDEPALLQRLAAEGLDPAPLMASVRKLSASGVPEELAARFIDAVRLLGRQETVEEEDRARSKAERFLYDMLESMAETAGLFELNLRLEFRHGPAPAEVDLLAAELKLAIELDGSYYHLRDPDAYRRDRRKDWQFQRHGYLVLRFLADDVVERFEEILDTILAAVAIRRQTLQPK